jgi:DNA modification methylase
MQPTYPTMEPNTIYQGDAATVLATFPAHCVDCVVTSPPYWGLRDYGDAGQLGREPTAAAYLDNLLAVMDETARVLAPTGTLWVNLGDSYRAKSLACLPFRFAAAMVERGWLLRNTIIWHKPACRPEHVADRFTVDFEYLFFFARGRRYHFAQQTEAARDRGPRRRRDGVRRGDVAAPGRNRRAVWSISPRASREGHTATFPEALVATPIRAGCPEGGIVLDPFLGSGTTAVVAKRLGRRYVGIELNAQYVAMARERIARTIGNSSLT